MEHNPRPPTPFALVIGINKYAQPSIPDLQGAVPDADNFEEFLKSKLRVQPSNIISLRDKQATRAAILQSFLELISNDKIQDGDPIIIYYAGHGARVKKPQSWMDWPTTSDKIEVLCPYDMTQKPNPIPGIPDRTIASLLSDLSVTKGDNITLILDCCSSAGLTRISDANPPYEEIPTGVEYAVRQTFDPPLVPDDCDVQFIRNGKENRMKSLEISSNDLDFQGFSGKYRSSHILLAACGEEQLAREIRTKGPGGIVTSTGVFTRRLVDLLNSSSLRKLTYKSLMHKLEMPKWQTPHCEGLHVLRRLFDAKSPGANPQYIVCQATDGEAPILFAGAAHGILPKSKYSIHYSDLDDEGFNESFCTLIVTHVEAYKSKLDFELAEDAIDLPDQPFYAKKIHDPLLTDLQGRLTITSNELPWLKRVFKFIDDPNIVIVENAEDVENADLTYEKQEDGTVYIDRRDPISNRYVGKRLLEEFDSTEEFKLVEMARTAQHYKYHFNHVGPQLAAVTVELFLLKEQYDDNNPSRYRPITLDLIQDGNIALVKVENEYGLQIYNGTDIELYCSVFYFDPRELSIDCWFRSATGAGTSIDGDKSRFTDPSLPPHTTLQIGHGSSNTEPWYFELREGEETDVGFFKIYFASEPVEFDMVRNRKGGLVKDLWGTKTITVVQTSD